MIIKKFRRNYRLLVETQRGDIREIRPPFTLNFDVQRNDMSSASTATISVLNLSHDVRKAIWKDQYDYGDLRDIRLEAGYENNLQTIFNGHVKRAYSQREGTEMVTRMECFDGGFAFANSTSSRQYQKGTPNNVILQDLAGDLRQSGVTIGAVGEFSGSIKRGNSYNGGTTDLLKEISGNKFFIDNNQAFLLNDYEYLNYPIYVINSTSGLMGTPLREKQKITVTVLFSPEVQLAQRVLIESQTAPEYNGDYKVVGVHHKGTISSAVGGSNTTELTLFYGSKKLQSVGLF